ncbi:MAG TPA: glutaredoxin 3 [Burkholderiales bacterium]|nr:glutaredoxin 3 [Burkholderiales bacterium]
MKVIMYTSGFCPFCMMAERLLRQRGVVDIHKIRVDLEPSQREQMVAITGRRTVPQIFINETYVGGYDELATLDGVGGLLALLEGKDNS